MKLHEFDFDLPERLIAQHPAPERDLSRMMVIRRKTGEREHCTFRQLPEMLNPEHFLVVNNTRVFPARLRASRPGRSEEIEVLLLKELRPGDWLALLKPARKAPPGQELVLGNLSARVMEAKESGSRILRFSPQEDLYQAFEKMGEPPIPPYIRRTKGQDFSQDRLRYQTVYARHSGSIAAPTAGLHFTDDIFRRLEARGIPVCELLLHVGYGTFQPVRCQEIEKHRMEPEYFSLESSTAARIRDYKAEGRKLVAVGTTTTRCLEFLARNEDSLERASSGFCDLFIYPGFEFRLLDGLLTNFHLPKSTLFMLVCAFAGRELMLDCYREAISRNYRFYSYGDCMLIL
ncbi:MAG: tRNA preQ1(34) S-adenosylmethionine ribosyltransferase-isomerase QueA [Acidobacteria bacterium]|nr:tRNA preQ1(34) S-adenosylmethionine ribosyltransferase-isomerase QueA [Acidobacteriota bacterium]